MALPPPLSHPANKQVGMADLLWVVKVEPSNLRSTFTALKFFRASIPGKSAPPELKFLITNDAFSLFSFSIALLLFQQQLMLETAAGSPTALACPHLIKPDRTKAAHIVWSLAEEFALSLLPNDSFCSCSLPPDSSSGSWPPPNILIMLSAG